MHPMLAETERERRRTQLGEGDADQDAVWKDKMASLDNESKSNVTQVPSRHGRHILGMHTIGGRGH